MEANAASGSNNSSSSDEDLSSILLSILHPLQDPTKGTSHKTLQKNKFKNNCLFSSYFFYYYAEKIIFPSLQFFFIQYILFSVLPVLRLRFLLHLSCVLSSFLYRILVFCLTFYFSCHVREMHIFFILFKKKTPFTVYFLPCLLYVNSTFLATFSKPSSHTVLYHILFPSLQIFQRALG
jgi:hypothetical protein